MVELNESKHAMDVRNYKIIIAALFNLKSVNYIIIVQGVSKNFGTF